METIMFKKCATEPLTAASCFRPIPAMRKTSLVVPPMLAVATLATSFMLVGISKSYANYALQQCHE
jgi:hypothetical protein